MQPAMPKFQVLLKLMKRHLLAIFSCTCVPFKCEQNTCANYREFDLEGYLARVPHTWYFIFHNTIETYTQIKI